MTGCAFCGGPVDERDRETHHHNGQRDDDPDNLRDVHRRCHMSHHRNDRAVDNRTTRRYGPRSPMVEAPGGF